MAWVRCPLCTHAFRAQPREDQVCPACGHRAKVAPGPGEVLEPIVHEPLPEGLLGKPRRTWGYIGISLLLSLVNFAWLYALIWYCKVFREVDHQHNRYHLVQYYILSYIPVLNLLFAPLYLIGEMGKLRVFRRAHGLKAGPSAVWPVIFILLGLAVLHFALVMTVLHGADNNTFLSDRLDDAAADLDKQWNVDFYTKHPTATGFSVLVAPALALLPVFAFFAMIPINRSLKGLWKAIYAEKGVAWPWGHMLDAPGDDAWADAPAEEPAR